MKTIYHVVTNSFEYFNPKIIADKTVLTTDEGHISRLIHWMLTYNSEFQHILLLPSTSLSSNDPKELKHEWGFRIKLFKSCQPRYPLEISFSLIKFLRQLPPDSIIHFHGVTSPIYSSCAFFLSGRKFIANYRGGWYKLGKGFFMDLAMILGFKILIPLSLLFASVIISESKKGYKEYSVRYSRKKVYYIPGCIDLPDLKKINYNFSGSSIKLLFVGQFIPRKGILELIDVFCGIKVPNLELNIIGNGPLLPEIIASAQVDQRIKLLGVKKNSEMKHFYFNADVFILPTYHESFGWVLLEAMSIGLPVISTQVEGPIDIISSGKNGILIPPLSKVELKKAILLLINNKEVREKIGLQGRETVENEFSAELITKKFIEIYRNL